MESPIRYDSGDEASRALAASDPAMARLIAREGCVEFAPAEGGPLDVLVRGIVGQQLSGAAAASIYRRLADTVGLSPEALASASVADLHAAGLSGRKASYIRALAQSALSGDFDPDGLRRMDDEEAIGALKRLQGVGRWTAHMFLIFALGRTDVLPVDDVGVRAAAGRVLGLGRPATEAELESAGERWKPHRTAAALYLWREGRTGFGVCGEPGPVSAERITRPATGEGSTAT